MSDLLPIGRFARLCRLSIKQLRHYDERGLLTPASVDPHTGYRYYRAEQARDAMAIGLLRSLDVPLDAIAEVLGGGTPGTLKAVRDDLEVELDRRRRGLAALERILETGLPAIDVTVTEQEPSTVSTTAETTTFAGIARAIGSCVAQLADAHRAAGVALEGPLTGLFPLDIQEEFVVRVAAPRSGDAPEGTTPDTLAGGGFAVATHVGPYDLIGLTYHGLFAWCGEHGHAPTGPVREVYLAGPVDTPPDRLVTRLLVRLEPLAGT